VVGCTGDTVGKGRVAVLTTNSAAPARWQEVEIRGKSTYHENADEFIRREFRDRTGWRRDEWAHSPLFICGNFGTYSPGSPSGTP
jgi:hypothetical protein